MQCNALRVNALPKVSGVTVHRGRARLSRLVCLRRTVGLVFEVFGIYLGFGIFEGRFYQLDKNYI